MGLPVTRVLVDVARPSSKLRASIETVGFFLRHQRTFDLVHLHGFSQKSILLVLLSRLFGKKVVITIHTAGQDEPDAIRGWAASRITAIRARTGSLPSATGWPRTIANQGCRSSGSSSRRMQWIPNDSRRSLPRLAPRCGVALGIAPDDLPWILFVGFFSEDKRPELLFEAWLRTYTAGTRTALIFVGATKSAYHEVDPAIADRIRARAREQGLDPVVQLVGEVPDVERYYQACDVFVMPSRREAFGMALAEAMSCARPSIATRIDGVTDMIVDDGRTGVLVQPDDAAGLADAIGLLLTDPGRAERIGAAARESIVRQFGIAASVDAMDAGVPLRVVIH